MKTSKTTSIKKEEVKREWHFVDVDGQVLGRVASDVAVLLMGKNKPTYAPNINVGDKVVVVNASKIAVTGNKKKNKIYKYSTGYPGSVKKESLGNLLERKPEEVLRRAVKGMLPKNKLRKDRMGNLYIYPDGRHPHKAHLK